MLEFHETEDDTMVSEGGRDVPSHGRIWPTA